MFTSPIKNSNNFAAQIETQIIPTLDAHALKGKLTKLPKTECWQDEHIEELKHRQKNFEHEYRQKKNLTYKCVQRTLSKTTNAAI